MKILILSHMYPNNINKTYGVFVHEQVKELRKQGHEVKVISPVPYAPPLIKNFKKKWKKYDQIKEYEEIDEIEIYHPKIITIPRNIMIDKSGYIYFNTVKRVISKIYKTFNFDVIHAHVALPDGYAGNLIGKRYNKPVVLTIHGKDIYGTVNLNEKAKKSVEQALNGCDKLVVVSKRLKELTSEYTNKDIDIIENGVDLEKVDKKINLNDLTNYYKEKFKVLSVGYLIERKGQKFVIEAIKDIVKKHDNIVYLIVGEGEKQTELQALVDEYGLQKHVEFIGPLSHEDVMKYMRICDVFALPSWNEAFGVVYAEAMANFKPVIACKNEGIDGIVKDSINGILVEPKSSKDIYSALMYLIENPKARKLMGDLARNDIQYFTWENNVKRNVKLYKEAIKIQNGEMNNGK